MGRRKREGNYSEPHKKKVLQDLEQNEENGYPDPRLQQNKDKLYQGTQQTP
jgi:hypothetical protein